MLQKSAIMEINLYLSQMDPAELAAALKLFRTSRVLKSQYVGETDGKNMMTGAVKGLVSSLGDPYSVYMDPKMYKEIILETKGSFSGVGIVLGVKEKKLTVVAPIEGTPAEAAGILSGDQILRIDEQDTKDMQIDEAVSKIRGPEGSQVKLLILRAGQEQKEYPLTRATIQFKNRQRQNAGRWHRLYPTLDVQRDHRQRFRAKIAGTKIPGDESAHSRPAE